MRAGVWFPNLCFVVGFVLGTALRTEAEPLAREVSFPSGKDTVSATLYLPGPGRHPALIVLAAPSEGGRKQPMRSRISAVIRQPLLDRGYAVLVYDAVGVGESSGSPATTIEEEAVAGRAAFRFLAAQPEIDAERIGLYAVSHSGWTAPVVAAQEPRVRGVVLISTAPVSPLQQGFFSRQNMDFIAGRDRATAERVGSIRRAIQTYLATGQGYDDAKRAYAELEADTSLAYFKSQRPSIPATLPTLEERTRLDLPYFRTATFDPSPWIAAMRQPTLVLLGESDPLVNAPEAARIFREHAAKKPRWDLTVKVYPGAGHALELRSERSPIHDPGAPRAKGHPDELLAWLDQRLRP